jgi:four helix bundle protein
MQNKGVLAKKTLSFSIRIVNLYKYLCEEKKEFVMSKQILRSGTNPGAIVREAANAESGMDFIHKLAIAQKEIAESSYWLELLVTTEYLNKTEYDSIDSDAKEIMRLLRSSILTRKQNLQKNEK